MRSSLGRLRATNRNPQASLSRRQVTGKCHGATESGVIATEASP